MRLHRQRSGADPFEIILGVVVGVLFLIAVIALSIPGA